VRRSMLVTACAALVAAGVRCDEGGPARLDHVEPASGPNDRAVPVEIRAHALAPAVGADVGCDGRAHADVRFQATLGDHLLEEVAWQTDGNLAATVPAGLPLGTYDLHVLSPTGEELTLLEAYQVVGPGDGDAGVDGGTSCETLYASAETASSNGTTMNGSNALGPPDGMAGQVSGQWAAAGESWTFSFPASTLGGSLRMAVSLVLWTSGQYVDDRVLLESSVDGGQTWTQRFEWGVASGVTFPALRAEVGPLPAGELSAAPLAAGQGQVRLRGGGAAGPRDNFTLHIDSVALVLCP